MSTRIVVNGEDKSNFYSRASVIAWDWEMSGGFHICATGMGEVSIFLSAKRFS